MKHLKRRIGRAKAEIANIKTLPYYRIFNREDERAVDLAEAEKKLSSLQSQLAAVEMQCSRLCHQSEATPSLLERGWG